LCRWGVSDGFAEVFARAYQAGGGVLPDGWPAWVEGYDAANLVGLLEGVAPDSQRAHDVKERLARWVSLAG
jgi:hypothetical protein